MIMTLAAVSIKLALGFGQSRMPQMLTSIDPLDRLLDAVGRALSPEAACRLLAIRADADAQTSIDELADHANGGLLTPNERAAYESLIAAGSVIAVLQAKARAQEQQHAL
jgi:hypothetical protein